MVSCAQRCRDFGLVLFNPKEKTCLRRTCKSWTLIIIYFCIFYSCLAAYFVGVLSAIVYGITDPKVPTLTGMQSLLKLNPGLGVLPPVDPEATLVQVPMFDSKQRTEYLAYMENYLKQYKHESTNCNFTSGDRDNWSPDEPCEFPLELLGPCASPATYMQEHNNICIYIKMNKIYGYLPDVPDKKVLVQCGPATSFDGENLNPPVFYPSVETANGTFGYFSSVAFPYLNQPGFQSPLLAVTFPDIRKNTVVMVSCTLVNVATPEPLRFDLSIDDVKSIAFP